MFATSQVMVCVVPASQVSADDWDVTWKGPEFASNDKTFSSLAVWPAPMAFSSIIITLLSLTFIPNFIVLPTDGNTSQGFDKFPAITVFRFGK